MKAIFTKMRRPWGVVSALAVFTFSANAFAQKTAADISVEYFFKVAEFQSMVLSPSGKLLAASTPFKGRQNLVIVDLEKRTNNVITSFEKQDAVRATWVSDDRICFRAADGLEATGVPRLAGTFCVDADGKNFKDFTKLGPQLRESSGGFSRITILGLVAGEKNKIYAGMSERTRDSLDVYKLDTMTGRYELLSFESPGRVSTWVLDRNGVPRAAVRNEVSTADGYTLWMRSGPDAKYEQIGQYRDGEGGVTPLAFDWEGNLYVSSSIGRDKSAIFMWDMAAKKPGKLIAEDPLVDIEGGLIFSAVKKKLVGISYQSGMPVQKWFDADYETTQKMVDASVKDVVNQISFPRDNDTVALIFSASDVDPGRYALLNREKKTLEPIVSQRSWIKPELMSPRKFIQYKARDGRMIPAYVTIPKNSEGKNLPLIIDIHGGPNVRGYDYYSGWGRWPDAQFFASRGYVVLQPEPRASTGFGAEHYKAGLKQWGLTMQDDITDGALHLVKEGTVNKERMCLHGGSYGGYASLQGMVKDPDLFKCANSFIAVTDLFTLQNYAGSDTSRFSDYLETLATKRVGDSKTDREQFEKTSPARNADKIKGKIILTMGAEDIRVPLVHGDQMVTAMQKAGVKHEYYVFKTEAHGFNKPENIADFYKRALKLFNETIGGSASITGTKVVDPSVPKQ